MIVKEGSNPASSYKNAKIHEQKTHACARVQVHICVYIHMIARARRLN